MIALLCGLFSGCTTEYSAVYQSIDTKSKWDESDRIIIASSKHELPLYKIKANRLYLMIQTTQSDWFFHTVINYPSWDKPEMSQLIAKHGDLRALVPVDWNNWLPKGFGDECIPK